MGIEMEMGMEMEMGIEMEMEMGIEMEMAFQPSYKAVAISGVSLAVWLADTPFVSRTLSLAPAISK